MHQCRLGKSETFHGRHRGSHLRHEGWQELAKKNGAAGNIAGSGNEGRWARVLAELLFPGHTVSQVPDNPTRSYSSPHSGDEETELKFIKQLA